MPPGTASLTDVEADDLLHQLAHRLALDAGRLEHALHARLAGRRLERLIAALDHLPARRLGMTEGVHYIVDFDPTGEPGALEDRWIAGLGDVDRGDRIVHLRLQERLAGYPPGSARHAGRDAALDPLPAEVRGVEALVQIDRRNLLRDLGRRHDRLEAERRRIGR